MNYGLFIKTLGPHGAPRVPWGPQGSKFGPGGRGPNFDPRGPWGPLGSLGGPGGVAPARLLRLRLGGFGPFQTLGPENLEIPKNLNFDEITI